MDIHDVLTTSHSAPKLKKFWDCYEMARVDGALPAKPDLPMRELAPLIPCISVLERVSPDEIIHRIVGEDIINSMRFNATGKNLLDFLPAETRDLSVEVHTLFVEFPCGNFTRYENTYKNGARRSTETLTLPLKANRDDYQPRYLISFHQHHETRGFVAPGDTVKFGTRWEISDLVDVGFGLPAPEIIKDLQRRGRVDP